MKIRSEVSLVLNTTINPKGKKQMKQRINTFQMKWQNNPSVLSWLSLTAFFFLGSPDAFAVGNGVDVGLNSRVANLTSILNNSLVPIILITGCLAGVAFSFMKSSPTPFIIAFITTASFGFAKSWIGGTYAVCA